VSENATPDDAGKSLLDENVEGSLGYFCTKFFELQDKARSYGVASVVGLSAIDGISDTQPINVQWQGGTVYALGIASQAEYVIRRTLNSEG
jgi:hypothetical protein